MSTKVRIAKCPKCGCACHKKKDITIRKLKHCILNAAACTVELSYIRYNCKQFKKTFYEDISQICQKYYRYTNVTINNVLSHLGDTKISIKSEDKINNMNVKLLNKLYTIKVHEMNLNSITTLPVNIGIDEFKGNMKTKIKDKMVKIKYEVQITDLDTGKVIAVLPIKDGKWVTEFLSKIVNKDDMKIVAIDMSMQFSKNIKRRL